MKKAELISVESARVVLDKGVDVIRCVTTRGIECRAVPLSRTLDFLAVLASERDDSGALTPLVGKAAARALFEMGTVETRDV